MNPRPTSLVSELFVRGLGVVYVIAFASLAVQVIGLIGARGIAPAAELLADGLELPTWRMSRVPATRPCAARALPEWPVGSRSPPTAFPGSRSSAHGRCTCRCALSLLLCAALLDDDALPRRVRAWLAKPAPRPARRFRRVAHELLALLLLAASLVVALQRVLPLPAAMRATVAWTRPLRSIHSYGLFAVMTTQRHEIALEGSSDGISWHRYHFRWKPDELDDAKAG